LTTSSKQIATLPPFPTVESRLTLYSTHFTLRTFSWHSAGDYAHSKHRMKENFLKATKSICPECHNVLPAKVFEKNNMVMMSKSCPIHGNYEDVYWSD